LSGTQLHFRLLRRLKIFGSIFLGRNLGCCVQLWYCFVFFNVCRGSGQEEGIEESEASAQEFLRLLESPLYDLELRKLSAGKWLAQCEQVLQQAVELLDPSLSSGLVIIPCSGSHFHHSCVLMNAGNFN
jgi:hypothetical protein